MLLKRSSVASPLTACAILVFCVCVFMQMLGTTMTLWDLDYDLDPVHAALLEGLSLPASFFGVPPPVLVESVSDSSPPWQHIVAEQLLFRPPNVLT